MKTEKIKIETEIAKEELFSLINEQWKIRVKDLELRNGTSEYIGQKLSYIQGILLLLRTFGAINEEQVNIWTTFCLTGKSHYLVSDPEPQIESYLEITCVVSSTPEDFDEFEFNDKFDEFLSNQKISFSDVDIKFID